MNEGRKKKKLSSLFLTAVSMDSFVVEIEVHSCALVCGFSNADRCAGERRNPVAYGRERAYYAAKAVILPARRAHE